MDCAIKYFERKDIDAEKWNRCIDSATNGLIYAKTYYLDAIANNWSGVILNDYEAVMPLTFKRKYTITYVCMPPFIQQLGIFFKESLTSDLFDKMMAVAHQKFRFGEYNFNHQNENNILTPRNNYLLSLNQDYTFLKKNYKDDLKKNLTKAAKNKLKYSLSSNASLAISTFKLLYKNRLPITNSDYNKLEILSDDLFKKKEILVREVKNANNDLLSIALCLKDMKRIYFLLSATTLTGRKLKANHYLLDKLINEFASHELQLDFEGSDIDGIAHFYKNFGSKNEPYYFHRWNALPWPLALLKR